MYSLKYMYRFYMKELFIFFVLLTLCSCHSNTKSKTVVWHYDDFISANVRMSDIADEMTIIQPDSIDYQRGAITHTASFFLVGTEQGVLKYNNEGHLIGKIGSIGQGPEEYAGSYTTAINEVDSIIYVFCRDNSKLLSFSYNGTFLSKHSVRLPKEWIWKFYYLKDRLYFYYTVNAGESHPYMYAITDTIGNLLTFKRDESLHFVQGNYHSFSSTHLGCLGDAMLVWNQYSDTIYRVSEKGEELVAMWGKWDKRLTPAKMEDKEFSQCMVIYTIVETINYFLCIWRPFDFKDIQWNFCFYDKLSGKLFNSVGLVDDLWGLPLFFPYNYFIIDGREYLEALYQPHELMDAWLSSDNTKIREQTDSIDEEGNNVLIRIRLKK